MDSGFYNMDCMEGMKQFPDKFFDLAIVDPPYGINADSFGMGDGLQGRGRSVARELKKQGRLNAGAGKLKNRLLNQSDCSWDNSPPPQEYFDELCRVSHNQIVWGGNYFHLPPTRGIVVWDKVQPWENFSQVEIAWTSFDRPAALYRYKNTTDKGKIHPTQKPVSLYSWLLQKFAKQGDKILDTHVGSASSLIACHRAGLEYWGFEIDPLYYEKAKERLERETAQVNIMDILNEGMK